MEPEAHAKVHITISDMHIYLVACTQRLASLLSVSPAGSPGGVPVACVPAASEQCVMPMKACCAVRAFCK